MTTLEEKNQELERRNSKLLWQNLQMRMEIEVLVDSCQSKAAQKILAKYRRKRTLRNIDKTLQN